MKKIREELSHRFSSAAPFKITCPIISRPVKTLVEGEKEKSSESINEEDNMEIVEVIPPYPIPWYPNHLAWCYENITRSLLSRCPELKDFFEWVKVANEMVY
jgi:hypothetical protein